MDALSKRYGIRDALAAGLASAYLTVGTGWQVYPEPPKALSVPCVILSPREPYRINQTANQEQINLTVTALLPFGANLDRVDKVLDVLRSSLPEGTQWVQASYGGVNSETGVDYIEATLDVSQ